VRPPQRGPEAGRNQHHKALREGRESFNRGDLERDALREIAVRHGFGDVIDAFHALGGRSLEERFFIDERKTAKGIRLTDEFRKLGELPTAGELSAEIEARWRVVETGWELDVNSGLVEFEAETGGLGLHGLLQFHGIPEWTACAEARLSTGFTPTPFTNFQT
jgi:hypothetical protein